ncbi:tyrosine-type recombinase/integrase [Thermobrachium celere]|uniref:tyrosine-type recombinase/integrase n=1 Tax=Thermobrachium celere TaxID=53422 RepID=UPI001A37DF56|nr:tyrosine-type recombinase/integrase [Thermobrachium celere]GFR35345.1 hypothetical protein TCEA9_11570 [Thermobrachium celere]
MKCHKHFLFKKNEKESGVLEVRRGEVVGKQRFNNLNKVPQKKYTELLEEYLKVLKIKGRSEYTIKSCEYHSKYFLEFAGEDLECKQINEELIQNYILYMQEQKQLTNGYTINSYIRNISPVIKFGIKKGYILEDFEMPTVKFQETMKEIYTQDELKFLLEKPKKKNFKEIRTWTIIWVLASTGIRARELRELKVKNIDLLNRVITVNQTKNKKARYIPISNSLAEVLEYYMLLRCGQPDDYLFCSVYNGQMAMTTLQKVVKTYCNERGIEKTSLHLFRHTFITNAVNKNISPVILKSITGHSTFKELNRYYNAKTTDLVTFIDDIAPKMDKKSSYFKKRK